jgi:hypothetical protein
MLSPTEAQLLRVTILALTFLGGFTYGLTNKTLHRKLRKIFRHLVTS